MFSGYSPIVSQENLRLVEPVLVGGGRPTGRGSPGPAGVATVRDLACRSGPPRPIPHGRRVPPRSSSSTYSVKGRFGMLAAVGGQLPSTSRSFGRAVAPPRLGQSLRHVLGDRPPTAADVPNLPFTEYVVKEALASTRRPWGIWRAGPERRRDRGLSRPPRDPGDPRPVGRPPRTGAGSTSLRFSSLMLGE